VQDFVRFGLKSETNKQSSVPGYPTGIYPNFDAYQDKPKLFNFSKDLKRRDFLY
jgi:hypothetical protein